AIAAPEIGEVGAVYVVFGTPDSPLSGMQNLDVLVTNGRAARIDGDNTVNTELAGGYGLSRTLAIGDMNGDGIDDIVMGDPRAAPGGDVDRGLVTIVFGDSHLTPDQFAFGGGDIIDLSTPGTIDVLTIGGEFAGDGFGGSLDVGDFATGTFDGVSQTDDLIVNATGHFAGGLFGAAYLFVGAQSGITTDLSQLSGPNGTKIVSNAGASNVAFHVASVGDVDGDGKEDFGITSDNEIGIFYNPDSPLTPGPKQFGPTLFLENAIALQGRKLIDSDGEGISPNLALAGLGDINGDGFDDFSVRAFIGAGAATYLVLGTPRGFRSSLELSNSDLASTDVGTDGKFVPFQHFGPNLGFNEGIGDINGDGFDDIALLDGVGFAERPNFVFGDDDLTALPREQNDIDGDNGFRGHNIQEAHAAIASAGDFNGDGRDDFIVSTSNSTSSIIFGRPFETGGFTLIGSRTGQEMLGGDLNDILQGRAGNDALRGFGGDDTLFGGQGNDLLLGEDGDDRLDGATGDDRAIGGGGADALFGRSGKDNLDGGDGDDRIYGDFNDDVATGGDGDDEISGNGGDDVLSGGDGADKLVAGVGDDEADGGAGADTIFGQSGDDVLTGGAGDDKIYGQIGVDTLDGGDGDDMLLGQDGDDTVNGGKGADRINGGEGNDLLNGEEGDDVLTGEGGIDRLDGGAGADDMSGGTGSDVYVVDNVGDIVREAVGGDVDTISTSLAAFDLQTVTGVENLQVFDILSTVAFTGIGDGGDNRLQGGSGDDALQGLGGDDIILGFDGDDVLIGGVGDDELFGGLGDDIMRGGLGDDTYAVDSLLDVTDETGGDGVDQVNVTNLGSGVRYTLAAGIENAIGVGPTILQGNELDNRLQTLTDGTLNGGDGDDTLIGSNLNNFLVGGAGADRMEGLGGSDRYVVDNVGDVVVELFASAGTDQVISSIDFTLSIEVENLRLFQGAVNGTGSSRDNIIQGNGLANVLDGAGGDDTLIGGAGNDTYFVDAIGDVVNETAAGSSGLDLVNIAFSGGFNFFSLGTGVENGAVIQGAGIVNGNSNANDITAAGSALAQSFNGFAGDDLLIGGNAGDTLNGGADNDELRGGGGVDIMAGGTGDDLYIVDSQFYSVTEVAGEGDDTVESTANFSLSDHIETLTLLGAAVFGDGNNQANMLIGNTNDNTLDGREGADIMAGSAGNDVYFVENIADLVDETAPGSSGVDLVNVDFAGGFNQFTLGTGLENGTVNVGGGTFNGNSVANVLSATNSNQSQV
ncbi:MAG: calcium-binding protein, partial [Alphaproteobacteria bacterium]